MVFTLNAYNDLGRCSFGTLRDVFDTEKDEIIDKGRKVEINCIEDLFPYLWQSAGIAWHSEGRSCSEFHGADTHWHRDFDDSIAEHEKDIAKLQKKIKKAETDKKREKYTRELEYMTEHTARLKEMLVRLDREMEEQKQKLIEENRTK